MRQTILARHPDPSKQGVNIDTDKYRTIRDAIESVLRDRGTTAFRDLIRLVRERLGDTFDGSIPWYVTTVKLDLEARDVIERVPNRSPQQLRLKA